MDVKTTSCRLAFHGRLSHTFRGKDLASTELAKLKVFKTKSKEGVVERANNETEVICKVRLSSGSVLYYTTYYSIV